MVRIASVSRVTSLQGGDPGVNACDNGLEILLLVTLQPAGAVRRGGTLG